MGHALPKYTDPVVFGDALKKSTKAEFVSDSLRAEVSRITPTYSKREVEIRYSRNVGGVWQPFATCASPSVGDIISDFFYQCRIFNV